MLVFRWIIPPKEFGTVKMHVVDYVAKKGKSKKNANQQSPPNASNFVYNYSRAITWAGLNLVCRRDAVREAERDALMRYWKLQSSFPKNIQA